MIKEKKNKKVLLKDINKRNILKIIIEEGLISRIDIAKKLKISKPTVSVYIRELIDQNLVKETGKGNPNSLGGKRAILLRFNNYAGYIIGVMIGVKNIRIALTDLLSNIINVIKIPTEERLGYKNTINSITQNLNKIIEESRIDRNKIIGIGIGATGLVDSQNGIVVFSPNLSGWKNIRLKSIIEENIGIKTFLENECRVQAIAEKKCGIAKSTSDFVCIETGVGIGTGVFINNKLFSGNNGMAGEVGHLITNIEGKKLCHCGNRGCLETFCSIEALIDDIKNDVEAKDIINSIIERLPLKEEIFSLYKSENEIIVKHVNKNASYLGVGISDIIKMFNPELIIIHGEYIKFGENYLNKVKETVSKRTFPETSINYNIQFSKLGENVGILGATYMVFDKVFELEIQNCSEQFLAK